VILSLIAGATHVANAAALILLAPGASLAEYLSGSALYAMAVWINLWILPSAWGFREEALPRVRQGQLGLALATSIALLVAHPNAIGLAFVVLVLVDTFVFYTAPLLYRSDTRRTQMIDLTRACLATGALAATFLLFERSPTAYAWCLAGVAAGLGLVLAVTGWHRPPPMAVRAEPWPDVVRDFRRAFREERLRALLGARLVEVSSMLALAHFTLLGPLIALKLAIALAQALSNNARRYTAPVLMATAVLIYAGGIGTILWLSAELPRFVPETLRLVTLGGAAAVLPIMIVYFWLVLFGIREQAPEVAPAKDG
jgi:hypothetical protein